jgi:D-cysteine desulfhydrase
MRAVLVFAGAPGATNAGNLLLDRLLGAEVEWAGELLPHQLSTGAAETAERLRKEGARPFLVPFGGSDSLGARGYLACAGEILHEVPDVRHVVTALGSGGTMAGLVAGLGVDKVLGADVGARPGVTAAVADFASPLAGTTIDPATLRVRPQAGAGYKTYTPEAEAALLLAARTEALILDPTYTARAMAGLIAAVRDGDIRPGERTVFVHTGGFPGLFGHREVAARTEPSA